ncbi:MAG: phenylalanine--tRNA ligase subunit beta [Deltaproteobacteria bacterium]|nr:MAG: phenylalanine--tRNA ligase subunit beta [Deltaproteobacteria bacterium]
MLVSLKWLRSLVNCDAPPDEIAHRLTMAGLEVEAMEPYHFGLERMVVGRIQSIKQHPNVDHLKVCEVQGSERTYDVVCGAPNVAEGQIVPLGLDGASLADGAEISVAEIHGVLSQGMICSELELGLGEDGSGVMILPSHLVPGTPLAEALELEDIVLDIGITPNRADCLSVVGIAREVAALFGVPWSPPAIDLVENGPPVETLSSVTIEDPDLCPRYAARVVQNITIRPSPLWLRQLLEAQGVRAINNVVDVTNYVMLESGQPLHAFDYHRLDGHRIVVRRARPKETFVTLDGQDHHLQKDMLLICDASRGVALAGIMGGLNSEITEQTHTVLIESAYFQPTGTRRTAKTLGLSTESSYRFERGVDPEGVITALDRAAQLMAELGDGELAKGRLDVYPAAICREPVQLRVSKTNRFLGLDLSREEIYKLLESIQLEVRTANEDLLIVDPPSFRADLTREVDLMEEVARLAGYDRIPSVSPTARVVSAKPADDQVIRQQTKQILASLGFCEIVSYSFISPRAIELLQLKETDPRRRLLPLRNPLSEDQAVMRTSLVPGMLETAARNQRRNNFDLRLAELSKIFIPRENEELPEERFNLCALLSGLRRPAAWNEPASTVDFFDIKGAVETLFLGHGIAGIRWSTTNPAPYLRPGHGARILLADTHLGDVGEVHPQLMQWYDLKGPVFLFDMDFDLFLEKVAAEKTFEPLPRFPAVNRDLAIVVSDSVAAQDLLDYLQEHRPQYAESIFLFDQYRGNQVGKDQKSLAFRITYRSTQRSLTDLEVNEIHTDFSQKVIEAFQAQLRS